MNSTYQSVNFQVVLKVIEIKECSFKSERMIILSDLLRFIARTISGLFVLAKAQQKICQSRAKALDRQNFCQAVARTTTLTKTIFRVTRQ